MRKLLLGAAAISLSGCSFLGFGHSAPKYGYTAPTTNYSTPTSSCGAHHAVLANGNCLSRFNLEGGIGASYNVGGTVLQGSDATVVGTNVQDIDFDDAYDTGVRYELGASYAMSPNTKITAMGFIDEAESAGTINLGTVGGRVLRGGFSDYRSTGLELGLRKYFNPTSAPLVKSVRPYVEGRIGGSYQDAISLQNATIGGVAIGAGNAALSESGWVPTAAGLVGLETPLTRYSTVGIETGLRYTGETERTNNLQGTALNGINDGGDRLSVPLMLRGRYRF